jgi:hypothetical protein
MEVETSPIATAPERFLPEMLRELDSSSLSKAEYLCLLPDVEVDVEGMVLGGTGDNKKMVLLGTGDGGNVMAGLSLLFSPLLST